MLDPYPYDRGMPISLACSGLTWPREAPSSNPSLALIVGRQLLRAPYRLGGAFGEGAPTQRFVDQIADRRGALLTDQLAPLIDVGRVTAAEHGRPREACLGHSIVEQHGVALEEVAGTDPRPEEPPLIPAEEHVAPRHAPLDGRRGAVTVPGGHRERLRGDDAAEPAGGGEIRIEVERVGVLHPLGPT